ncbi:MAG: hypothetical protein OXG71_09465 [Rhodospirillales bacterium]|nr:hypothetical protein [Rhodospirillales bacterium]
MHQPGFTSAVSESCPGLVGLLLVRERIFHVLASAWRRWEAKLGSSGETRGFAREGVSGAAAKYSGRRIPAG